MNDESMSNLTTGADFDQAFVSAMNAETEEVTTETTSEPEAELTTDDGIDTEEEDTQDDVPDHLDTGIESEDDEDDLSELIGDVAEAIDKDDKDTAKRRLDEYGKGLRKLQTQVQQSTSAIEDIKRIFTGVSQGDAQALTVLNQVFESYGIDPKDAYAQLSGIDPSDLGDITSTPKTPSVDPRVERLERELAEMKQATLSQQWESTKGRELSSYLEQVTGLQVPVSVFTEAKNKGLLTGKMTAESIEDAVMAANPRAYRQAVNAFQERSQKESAPKSAGITKGNKSSGAKIDPNALLSNPQKFEEFLRS